MAKVVKFYDYLITESEICCTIEENKVDFGFGRDREIFDIYGINYIHIQHICEYLHEPFEINSYFSKKFADLYDRLFELNFIDDTQLVDEYVSVIKNNNYNGTSSTSLLGRDLLTPEEVMKLHYKNPDNELQPCNVKIVQEWKLELMANIIFKNLWSD